MVVVGMAAGFHHAPNDKKSPNALQVLVSILATTHSQSDTMVFLDDIWCIFHPAFTVIRIFLS
jgi:hypothetical protein